jgi:hypothetical protein
MGVVPSLARVDLAPLAESGLKAMIERATAGQSSAQCARQVASRCVRGKRGSRGGAARRRRVERKARIPVAAVLEQSIRRRLDALSPEARAWMEALAVLGDDVAESIPGDLAGLEERSPAAAAESIAAGLARPTPTGAFSRLAPCRRRGDIGAHPRAAAPAPRARGHALCHRRSRRFRDDRLAPSTPMARRRRDRPRRSPRRSTPPPPQRSPATGAKRPSAIASRWPLFPDVTSAEADCG